MGVVGPRSVRGATCGILLDAERIRDRPHSMIEVLSSASTSTATNQSPSTSKPLVKEEITRSKSLATNLSTSKPTTTAYRLDTTLLPSKPDTKYETGDTLPLFSVNYRAARPSAMETPNHSVKREKRDVEMAQEEELSSEEEGQMGAVVGGRCRRAKGDAAATQ